ncbi:MAG: hypothetical protein KJ667_06205 [Alphaproteobacteria bacterium]|nr:hypothetical protein [Alphaproteobacteria bacterium]
MTFSFIKKTALTVVMLQALAIVPAHATGAASEDALTFGQLLGEYCPGQWESAHCLKAVSQSNMVMVSNYGAALQESGKKQAAEQLKQHCAASTAGTEGDYPAYAMKSAFTECANTIGDLAGQTNLKPDLSHYQLLVGATMCLDGAAECAPIEKTLRQLAGR